MTQQYSTTYSRFHGKPKRDPIYAELIRQHNAIEAIPADKRTAQQREQLRRIKQRLDEIEPLLDLKEVQG